MPGGYVVGRRLIGFRAMDPLHATIEEFATESCTHIRVLLPSMPRDEAEANLLAPTHCDRADHLFHTPLAITVAPKLFLASNS
jgi:hypothetical protein